MKTLLIAVLSAAGLLAQGVDSSPRGPAVFTVATLPTASSWTNKFALVSDGSAAGDCTTGSGSTRVLCVSNGTAWAAVAGGGGAAATIFDYSKYLISENFPSTATTTGQVGVLGWTAQSTGGGTIGATAATAGWNGGLNLTSSVTSTSEEDIYLRGVAQVTGNGWGNLTTKTWRTEFLFRTPDGAATSARYQIGLYDDPGAPTGTGGRNFLYLRYLQGTDTDWVLQLDTGGTVTTACTGSAAPDATTYYILKMTGAGTSTITVQLLPSTTDFKSAQTGTDIFTTCTATLPATDYGPSFFSGNQASTANIHLVAAGLYAEIDY